MLPFNTTVFAGVFLICYFSFPLFMVLVKAIAKEQYHAHIANMLLGGFEARFPFAIGVAAGFAIIFI